MGASSGASSGVNEASGAERRDFARVRAPMYCRPARRRLPRRSEVVDIGIGGLRVYSDDAYAVHARMELDLFLSDDDAFVTCLTEVVWIREIPSRKPARYDMGLRFLDVPEKAKAVISRLVAEAAAEAETKP